MAGHHNSQLDGHVCEPYSLPLSFDDVSTLADALKKNYKR